MRTRTLILAAPLLFGCSLHRRPAGPEPARGPVIDSLFQLDQTRGDSIAARGPIDGVLVLLSPDVVYLRPGAPATYGRDAVRALLLETKRDGVDAGTNGRASSSTGGNLSWQPLGGGVSYDLRSAYTFGVAANLPSARARIRFERYIAFWGRRSEEPWRIVAYAEIGAGGAATPAPGRADDTSTTSDVPPPRLQPLSRSADEASREARAADSAFADLAYRMGVPFAFENTAASDAVVFGNPQLVIGPKAIGAFYETQRAGTSLTWHPVYASAASSRDLAFTVGESIATGRGPSGAAVQRFGKYLTIWRREKDGTWRFVVDGGNNTR